MAQAQLQPRSRAKRKRTWRKRRPGDPKHYSVTIGGVGWWQPSKSLRQLRYHSVRCGPDGPEARAIAEYMNREANVKKAAVEAAQIGSEHARSLLAPMHYPYDMLRAWSAGNAKQLRYLRQQFEDARQLQTFQTVLRPNPRREFEESLKFQTDQTQQPRSPMRFQTRPAPWWHRWLLR